MNWILICVIGILLINIAEGYHKGFVRIVFSLVAIAITLVFVSVATPHVTSYIEEHTTIDEQITARCLEHIEKKAQEQIDSGVQAQTNEAASQAKQSGLALPGALLDKIADSGGDAVNDALEESGTYNKMAAGLSHFIISGIAFFLSLIVIAIILHLVINALDLVAKLPIIKGVNHLLGLFAGLVKGLLIVWLLMYLVAICATSSFGLMVTDYINRSGFLSLLYEHNLIMMILLKIF